MNSIESIHIMDNRIDFVLINKESVTIKPSDCIKVLETSARYRFYLISGKMLNCQKMSQLLIPLRMDYSIICKSNFPQAEFVVQ